MPILYKYCPPQRMDILTKLQIRFTQPGDLNDPVENIARFSRLRTSWPQFVQQAKGLFPGFRSPDGDFEGFLKWLKPSQRDVVQRRLLQMGWDLCRGVLSLSSSQNNELMWTHYAESHRGFVIGFDKDSPLIRHSGTLGRVKYAPTMPKVEYLEDISLTSLIFTKLSKWSYEKEWRVVVSLEGRKRHRKSPRGYEIWLQRIPPTAIASITLGERMEAGQLRKISRILSRPHFSHVRVYTAKFNDRGQLRISSAR